MKTPSDMLRFKKKKLQKLTEQGSMEKRFVATVLSE